MHSVSTAAEFSSPKWIKTTSRRRINRAFILTIVALSSYWSFTALNENQKTVHLDFFRRGNASLVLATNCIYMFVKFVLEAIYQTAGVCNVQSVCVCLMFLSHQLPQEYIIWPWLVVIKNYLIRHSKTI